MKDIDQELRLLAASQHGVVARNQLSDLGLTPTLVYRRVRSGVLESGSPTVLRIAGAPTTPQQTAMLAVLDAPAPAWLSHQSAASLWGLPGFSLSPTNVIAPRGAQGRRAPFIATIHEPRRMKPHHGTEIDGIPITTPTRVLFDLATDFDLRPGRLERCLDTALSRQLVSIESLAAMLEDLRGRGRRGIRLMRELIEARSDGTYVAPESGLESRFRELVGRSGLPEFRRQVNVGSHEAWIGRVDFVHPDIPLIVEVDSATFHGSLTDQRHDRDRRARLAASGWTVLVVSGSDLFHRPDEFMEELRQSVQATRRAA